MRIRKFEVIECPRCKRQYLPAEIYVPQGFFGKPTDIERDCYGKLISYEGSSVDLFETYVCDCCNTEFRVIAKLCLTTEETALGNFEEDYYTPLKTSLFFEDSSDTN